jgi:hypothetical protein
MTYENVNAIQGCSIYPLRGIFVNPFLNVIRSSVFSVSSWYAKQAWHNLQAERSLSCKLPV